MSSDEEEIEQQDLGWDGFMEIKFLTDIQSLIEQVKNQQYQLVRIQHILKNAKQNDRRIFTCGHNHTHLAKDLFSIAGISAIPVGENGILLAPKEGDILIAVFVGGCAEGWKEVINSFNKNGGLTIGLCGDNPVDKECIESCNTSIVVPSEIVPITESILFLTMQLIIFMIKKRGIE